MMYENCIHCEEKGSGDNKYYYCEAKRKTINVYNCTSCPLRIEKIPEIKHILKARLTSITRKKGIKREIGVINFDSYDLNYCPVCGKKIDDDRISEKNIKTVREFLIDILSNKTRKKKIKIRYGAGYYTFYVEDFEFIKDCSGTGLVIGNILNHEIEIL